MAFIALARLRFGDGWIDPGGNVPVEPGRAYDQMVHRGEIALVPDDPKSTPDVSAEDELAKELAALNRKELDERAEQAGVEEPEKLPNKQAVIDAVLAAVEPEVSAEDESGE